jgi:hypothetical protein
MRRAGVQAGQRPELLPRGPRTRCRTQRRGTSRPRGSSPRLSEYLSLSQVTSPIVSAATTTKGPTSVPPPPIGMRADQDCASPPPNATNVKAGA